MEVSDEDVEKEFQSMADQYGMELDMVKKYLQPAQVKDQLITRKAVAIVVDSATATKPEKKAAKKDEEAGEKKPAKKSAKKAATAESGEEKPAKKPAAKKTKKADEESVESK